MNKRVLSCFIALVITGRYTGVTIASENSSNWSFETYELSTSHGNEDNALHNMKSIQNSNIELKILDDCKKMSDNNSDNKNIVDYDEETMWFDYQALFDKTKNVVLGKSDTTDVRHINFKEDDLARKALFKTDNNYETILSKVKNGDLDAQHVLIQNLLNFYYKNKYLNNIGNDILVWNNYCYLLSLVAALCDISDKHSDRISYTRQVGYCPNGLLLRDLSKVCYYDVVEPILGFVE